MDDEREDGYPVILHDQGLRIELLPDGVRIWRAGHLGMIKITQDGAWEMDGVADLRLMTFIPDSDARASR
jgi:hypothetical protein